MKHNQLSTNRSGTGKQIGLNVFLVFFALVCGLAIYSSIHIAVYKGNNRGLSFGAFALFTMIMSLTMWPRKQKPVYKGFKPNVDFSSSSRKLLRSMASEDRPE